jgi:hypothetical protein
MAGERQPADATLLDVLIDGFEKNEMLGGFHGRLLPMPNEAAAVQKFTALTDEAKRWKGAPLRSEEQDGRRLSQWPDLEVRQAGRGVMVRARAPRFDAWWHDRSTWAEDPMSAIFEWLDDEAHCARGMNTSG